MSRGAGGGGAVTTESLEGLWRTLEDRLLPVFGKYRSRLSDLPVHVKADRSLLTEADVAVQLMIVAAIREVDPGAVIIAEEDERTELRRDVAASGGRVWVVDPIDGTSQFVRPECREFCSVVCLLEDWRPAAAWVLAPELGVGRSPLTVTAQAGGSGVRLNGERVSVPIVTEWISATGGSQSGARPFDAVAMEAGFRLKRHATSQSLDMVRTAVDLEGWTDLHLPGFALFWRRRQKVWDGVAGHCLGAAAGFASVDEFGGPLPLGPELFSQAVPEFPSVVMGRPEMMPWYLGGQ